MANRVTKVALAALAQRPKLPSSPAPKASGGATTELPYYPGLLGQHFADGGAPKAKRDLSDVGLYSHGAEVAAGLPQAKGSPQQFKAMLKKAGVKDAEFENSGFDSAFADRPSVTKDEIAQHFSRSMPKVEERVLGGNDIAYNAFARLEEALQNHLDAGQIHNLERGRSSVNDLDPSIQPLAEEYLAAHKKWKAGWDRKDPKFSEYTLPGGENYREVLLKHSTPMSQYKDYVKSLHEKYGNPGWRGLSSLPLTDEEGAKFDALMNAASDEETGGAFTSPHWDDPNVLVHLRMSDRTGPNGEKILHVEEIQSDWGQEGRKQGFKKLPLTTEENSELSLLEAAVLGGRATAAQVTRMEELQDRGSHLQSDIPSAPYVTSTQGWTDLALKRVLKEAAEGGYDKLVWTPGEEQSKRYNLSHVIDRIAYNPATKELSYVKSGNQHWSPHPDSVEPKELANLIGKEASDALLSEPLTGGKHDLETENLKVGGAGMKSYYDKIVPTRLQELVKRHDPTAKVGMTDIMLPPSSNRGSNNPPIQAPGIDITPQMRDSIMQGGQLAFARGGLTRLHPAMNIPGVHIRTAEAGEPIFHGDK